MATSNILRNPIRTPHLENLPTGDVRRGLRNALIQTDANYDLAAEAEALAQGNAAEAASRRQMIELRNDQLKATPLRVGRVEDVGGIGDAIDYAQGQMGSGMGSMVDPLAAGLAAGGAGQALSAIPNPVARATGGILRGAGTVLAPAAVSARQLKGEFYGQARENPNLMGGNSAAEINDMANLAGAAGGALDAIVPGRIARGLVGAGQRAAGGGLRRFGQDVATESLTELGQGEVGRGLRGVLDPNQDTSGFGSDRLNEAVGGAIGGAPFSAAGAVADSGYGRADRAVSRGVGAVQRGTSAVQAKAGEVVDLATGAVKEGSGRARGKVIDLREQLKERTGAAKSGWQQQQEEFDLLNLQPNGIDPATPEFRQWFADNRERRNTLVRDRLSALTEDAEAQRILAEMDNPETADTAIDQGAAYVADNMRFDNVARAADRAGAAARKVGGFAAKLGKAAWEGAKRKQSLQGEQGAAESDPELMGVFMEDAAKREVGRFPVEIGGPQRTRPDPSKIPAFMGRMGQELGEMIQAGVVADEKAMLHIDRMAQHMAGAYGQAATGVAEELARMQPSDLTQMLVERVGQALSATGDTSTVRRGVSEQLVALLPPQVEKRLLREGINLRNDEGKRQLLGMVEALSMGRAPAEARRQLASIVGGDEVVNQMVEAIAPTVPEADGDITTVSEEQMAEQGLRMDESGNLLDVDEEAPEGSTTESAKGFEERQAQKKLDKRSGAKYYAFGRRPSIDNNKERRDPFGYTEKLSKSDLQSRLAAGEDGPRRPQLMKQDQKLSSGESAIDNKVSAMQRYLGDENVEVAPRSAKEVLDDLGAQPAKRLQLFADYMFQEGKEVGGERGEKMRDLGRMARKVLRDTLVGARAGKGAVAGTVDTKAQSTAGERSKVKKAMERYFNERYLVVGERMSDADPERIERADFDNMVATGKTVMAMREAKNNPAHAHENNILFFEDEKGNSLPIKADDVVKQARAARRATENESTGGSGQWVKDLMSGITALLDSGFATALPTRTDVDGEVESFADGIPLNLILPSGKLYGSVVAAQRRKPKTLMTGEDKSEVVAAEQAVDYFTPDDDAPPEAEWTPERTEKEALARAQRLKDQGDKRLVRQIVQDERRERLTTGGTRRGERLSEFEDTRIRTLSQGMAAENLPRGATGKSPTKKQLNAASDAALARAQEVAATPGKSRAAPSGEHESRLDTITRYGRAVGRAQEILTQAKELIVESAGKMPRDDLFEHSSFRPLWAEINAVRATGEDVAPILHRIAMLSDQIYGMSPSPTTVDKVRTRLLQGEAKLAAFMGDITSDPTLPMSVKIVAGAVTKVAGAVPVRLLEHGSKADGVYSAVRNDIRVKGYGLLDPASTVLHEGVHAATVRALEQDPELTRATYALLAHIVREDPSLQAAYGLTSTLELMAEGMMNAGLQQRLTKIRPSRVVSRYLGETAANAWDSFTALVRKALGLKPEQDSALMQLFELTGRAMKTRAKLPAFSTGEQVLGHVGMAVVPGRVIRERISRISAMKFTVEGRAAADQYMESVETRLMSTNDDNVVAFSHNEAVELEFFAAMLEAADGEIDEAMVNYVTIAVTSMSRQHMFPAEFSAQTAEFSTTPKRKLNAQAVKIHQDLGKRGFPATHDSPIRHEGKFDWRKHKGRGEGNASFGAGTYLSTSEGVHRSYKNQFSAMSGDEDYREIVYQLDSAKAELDFFEMDLKNAIAAQKAENWTEGREGVFTSKADLHFVIEHDGDWATDFVAVHSEHDVPLGSVHKTLQEVLDAIMTDDVIEEYQAKVKSQEKLVDQLQAELDGLDAPEVSPTYEVSVDIPADQLMDWNKPLKEQSKLVQKALASVKVVGEPIGWRQIAEDIWTADTLFGNSSRAPDGLEIVQERPDRFVFSYDSAAGGPKTISKPYPTFKAAEKAVNDQFTKMDASEATGEEVYKQLVRDLGSQTKTSDYLQSLGILGHKYAAAGGRNEDNPNYVIYDDSKIETNYVHFNSQTSPFAQRSTQAEQDQAKAYVERVLGPAVKTVFKDITGYAGEWIEATNTIEISTTAGPGAMQVAYHEALHGFFSKFVKNDPAAFEVLKTLADDPRVLRQLERLLAGDTAALGQLKDGEERLAYAYQFWAAGVLDLPYGKPRTLFRKIAKFFRRVLGMVTDTERAAVMFDAFHAGKFSDPVAGAQAMQDVLSTGLGRAKAMRKLDGLVQKAAALTLPAESILANSSSPTAQKIGQMFFRNPGDSDSIGEPGYLNARDQMGRRYVNEFSHIVSGMDAKDYKSLSDYMTAATPVSSITYAPHAKAVKEIRTLLKRFRQYMVDESGVKMGDLGDDYYPRVWSLDKLQAGRDAFMAMMAAKHPQRDADAVYNSLLQNLANDLVVGRPAREDGVLAPLNVAGEERVLSFMTPEDAAPFLEDNLVGVMTRYFHQGVRAAEYTKRFGQDGQGLGLMLVAAEKELADESRKMLKQGVLKDQAAADKWTARQMRDVRESVGAMEGTLGGDINGAWRATNSWVIVYQNIRLLPLSLFASFVDPMGMVARGAEFGEAFEAFKRGMTEVGRQWKDLFKEDKTMRAADQWERLAQYVGTVDAGIFEAQVADMYSSVYMSPRARAINETFFKLNGMEAWNRGMRVGATKAAVQFIQRHAKLPQADSQRWLTELGLQPSDIELDANGNLLVSVGEIAAAKGIDKKAARAIVGRVHSGINRWVTGAILTPNAAQRPAWSSDPHYSMFFHLKQFTYSFHQTILKRAATEAKHGNIAPLGALFWYIPVMIGSDIMKGMIQGGGELPAHMKGMDAAEWVLYGAERGGLMGLGQIGMDASGDLSSIAGPAVEQVIDAFSDPLERTTVRALPGNPLYREALL